MIGKITFILCLTSLSFAAFSGEASAAEGAAPSKVSPYLTYTGKIKEISVGFDPDQPETPVTSVTFINEQGRKTHINCPPNSEKYCDLWVNAGVGATFENSYTITNDEVMMFSTLTK